VSEGILDVAISVLEPLVGRAMATVYVSDAIRALGKASEELEPDDVMHLCDHLRSKLSPFAARAVVDQACWDITTRTTH
jgi:L-alanine-DL-glutamate epimerase-like enolase superfamily enzyme